jgi:pyruvate,water dikinase
MPRTAKMILWFDEITIDDIPLVGGKNASLGEMHRELSAKDIKIPNGFAITAHGYRHFLKQNDLDQQIVEILTGLDVHNIEDLNRRGRAARQAILSASLPEDLVNEISAAYAKLSKASGVQYRDVAVRSSATAEDLPDASFAGQQDSFLNVHGTELLLESCKKCFASLFNDRAISYRVDRGFSHFDIALSIGVQEMVRSDLASSGVMFSIDTETGFQNAVLINASYGLGENIVQGNVNPDEYYVFKPLLKEGFKPILQKKLGSKSMCLVYDEGGNRMTKNIPVPLPEQRRYAITDDEILQLARYAIIIEEHYSKRNGKFTPMDMEWAKDGNTGELFIVQARPETVHAAKKSTMLEIYALEGTGKLLTKGRAVGEKIAQGKVRIIHRVQDLGKLQKGEILVTDKTDPDWEPSMKLASAIVTNRGGRTCHAAIVSRELGLPAVIGCNDATDTLEDGQDVTVVCSQGENGMVYEGRLPFRVDRFDLGGKGRPKTKIMMNVANPEEAMRHSLIPNDGVGLARMEFIINNYIKVHPMALLDIDRVSDTDRAAIEKLTFGYKDRAEFFVEKLAHGVAMIAAAFYPNDVIVRMSDFKTNEYAHLLGGAPFEPQEENPMIGFRGASRYYHDRYRLGFALECQAMLRVREVMGLRNVKLMIPFCRTVEEGRKVIAEMATNGLKQGHNGLEFYVMCEIPSNVILADEFAKIFDGFSIGSNDLTQLTLGVDRDSEIVAHIFDERNPAVTKMISNVIRAARAAGRKIGICGQAPSDYPEFAEFLVSEGIDSISLNPDTVIKTSQHLLEFERTISKT